jgi:hypothetical protein
MKHLEDTPWFICDPEDENYCLYIDTDSNYFNAEPLLKYLYPDFDSKPDNEKDNLLEKIALQYQNVITKHYDTLAKECFNTDSHRLEMKTEAVIRSAYFRAPRRYAQWITKKEGIEKEVLDVKGLEYMKVNFPPTFGKMFQDIVEKILKGIPKSIIDQEIIKFRNYVINNKNISIKELGNPVAVKTLKTYTNPKTGYIPAKSGSIFSTIGLKTPAGVKAAIRYNDLLKFWKLDKTYPAIVQGDKIKWVYLKDNPYKIESIGFLDFEIPEKISIFIEEFIDREQIFDNILLNKLQGLYDDLSWNLNLNPHSAKFFQF